MEPIRVSEKKARCFYPRSLRGRSSPGDGAVTSEIYRNLPGMCFLLFFVIWEPPNIPKHSWDPGEDQCGSSFGGRKCQARAREDWRRGISVVQQ